MRWLLAVMVGTGLCLAPVAAPAAPAPGASSYRFLDEPASGAYDLITSVKAQGGGEARLCFGYRSPQDHYFVRVTSRAISLIRMQAGKEIELAPPYKLSIPVGPDPSPLLVKRRPEKIGVICRGVLVTVAGARDAGEGKVGVAAAGGFQVEPPRLQPVEPPAFSDDFMREASEASPWESASGAWSTTTVGDVKKSANGFSYRGAGSPGLAVTGFPFWDDYVVQASVKCAQPEGAIGIAAYVQDPKNYLALVWSSADGLRLVRVSGGTPTVLATKAAAWVENQWYRLGLQVLDGVVTAMVDGKVLFEVQDPTFGRGKIGLYAEGKEVYFDDVAVKPAIYFHDANPMAHRERWLDAGLVQVAGTPAWQDYTYRVRAVPADKRGLGIVFGWRSPASYFLFRWGADSGNAPGAGHRQLIRVQDGQRLVVADAKGGYHPGRAYRIETVFRPGYATVSIDGRLVLESADPCLTCGAVGLSPISADIKEVSVALHQEPTPPEEEITKEFTNSAAHPDMAEWANPARGWVLRPTANAAVFWRKGSYFGDVAVETAVPRAGTDLKMGVLVAGDGEDPRSGYTFLVQTPEAGKLTLQLLRQTAPIPVASVTTGIAPGKTPLLVVSRQGAYLLGDLDGKRILKYRDVAPLGGSRIGFHISGAALDLREVQVRSRNVYDYTFHDAPTDWQPQAGVWEITNRWSCSPGWSWFGGKSQRLAVIWNKRSFAGDLALEYYAAPKMDAVPEAYAERFRDLNATICADGERLNSGYSFLIGGWRNTKTAILRGDRIVAETSQYHLPPQKVGHRQWFYIRIEKRGNRISLAVDNTPLLSYEDPDPLPGDRVALWTQNNGLMLARALVCYEREKDLALVTRAPGKPDPVVESAAPPQSVTLPLRNDFEGDTAQWRGVSTRLAVDATTASRGKKSLAIINAEPGGEFKTLAVAGRFDAARAKTISFDYRIPSGIRVNLYVRIAQGYYVIGLTGQPTINPANGVLASLGKIEGVRADDAWHHATFDLLGALRKFFPTANPLLVDEVVLANWGDASDENIYVLAGVTGNVIGSRYHIDDFAIGETGAVVASGGASPAPAKAAPAAPAAGNPQPIGAEAAPKAPAKRAAPAPKPARLASRGVPGVPGAKPEPAAPPRKPAPAGPRVALFETFSGGKTAVNWEAMEGKWVVTRDGRFTPTEKPEFAYAFAGDLNWTDYVLKADLINGQDAGLCVRARDWNNCVFLVIRPSKNDMWWFVRRDGQWGGVLAPSALPVTRKPVMKMKVVVSGDTFTFYLDDTKVSEIKDPTFRKGRVGVYIHPAEAGQAWDNIEVILPGPGATIQEIAGLK